MNEMFVFSRYHSLLGTYILASSREGLVCVKTEKQAKAYFARWKREKIELRQDDSRHSNLIDQLDAYFAGKLRQFILPLDLRGTQFQHQVWESIQKIPWGETRSYLQIAEALGRPSSSRAVGGAVGSNPVAIVVPCHRVVGSGGNLTGYGGGLERKAALLELENPKAS
jgi:methylated-DNA-[protein]-cysteine S-methyltransferase